MIETPIEILLVEDDLSHAEIARRNLAAVTSPSNRLVHVADGQQALDYLRNPNTTISYVVD